MSSSVGVLAAAGLRGRRRGGLVGVFAVLTLAAAGISAGLVVNQQGAPRLDEVAADADVAHLVLKGDADAIRRVAAEADVLAWTGPLLTVGDAELIRRADRIGMEVTALDQRDVAVNRPPQRSGRWVSGPDEIVLDRSLAKDLGIDVGEAIELRLDATSVSYTVVGTAVNLTDCFYPQCDPGRAWVTSAGFARLNARDHAYSQAWLRFRDPADADPFVQRMAQAGIRGISGTESWLDTRDDFLSFDRVFGAFITVFGVFVLAVAAVVVAGTLAVRMVARRREIGLLGSIGCTPRQIALALLVEHLAVGAVAATAGWFLAGFLAPSLQFGIGAALGDQSATWTLLGLVISFVAVEVMQVVATIGPSLATARQPVTDVVRDLPSERTSRLTRAASRMPRRVSFLGARELASRPLRASLATLAVVVAVVGTLVATGFIGGITAVADEPARAGDPWDVSVAVNDTTAPMVERGLTSADGLQAWYTELYRRSTFRNGAFLSIAIGGDPDAARFHIAEGRTMTSAGEGIAGYGFLERFGVSVGDTIDVLAGTTPLKIHLVGWYRETEDSGEVLLYRLETLTALEPAVRPDLYRLVATRGTSPDSLARTVQQRLGADVRVDTVEGSNDALAVVVGVLQLVAVVLLLMAGVNLLTTLLTTNREATRRIGVQQTIGFTPRQLVAQGAMSGAALGGAAALVGLPLGLWLFGQLSDIVSRSIGVGPGWMPLPGWPAMSAIALLAVAASSTLGALAVARLANRPAAELVRWE